MTYFSSVIAGFYKTTGDNTVFSNATEPVVTSISLSVLTKGESRDIVVTGTTLTGTSAASFDDSDTITINTTTVDGATQITLNATVATDGVTGTRTLWVRTPNGMDYLADCLTITKQANYVLAQAYNTDFSASRVFVNHGQVPHQSQFVATAVWSDGTGAGRGYFSAAPNGNIIYCNGVETCIWGGEEIECTGFITSTAADTVADPSDYSSVMLNTRQDTSNVAVIDTAGADYWFIRSPRPIQGVIYYIATGEENEAASTMTGLEWTGSGWSALTLTDGTAVSGVSLAQNGKVTFDSTVATSAQTIVEGGLGYWYQFHIDAGDAKIYYVTLDAPFQDLVDIWCGFDQQIATCFKYTTTYGNYSINVLEDIYDSSDATTYLDLASFGAYNAGTGANTIVLGFFERQTAINFGVATDQPNTTAATTAAIDYWDGSAFTTVGTIVDGTSEGAISLAKSGTMSFAPPEAYLVKMRQLADNSIPLYYYRVRFDKALSGTMAIYYISGIPAPKSILGYKFPLYSQDRVMLCCNMDGKRNSILLSGLDTAQVFNGDDSWEEEFGDLAELTCGCTIFSQYGSNLFNITVLFKEREMWGYVESSSEWIKYLISPSIGCASPMTLHTVVVPPAEGQQQANRCYAVWATAEGVFISEGRHPVCVSADIRDLFDQNSTTHINQQYIENFAGYVDHNLMEYHLFLALETGTVTELDAEYVLDLKRWKWFEIDRGTGKKLQCATNVGDEWGNTFNYGCIDTGYMERLEHGTTFDGEDIVCTLHTGDFPMDEKGMLMETQLKAIVPVMAAKTTTANDITLTHYIDSSTTGTDCTVDPTHASHGLAFPVKAANSVPGIVHSIKMVMTTDDETCGFEPLMLGLYYQDIRELNYV